MGIAAMLVIGLTDGQGRAERAARWIARKLSLDEDKFAAVLRQVGERMEELVSDRVLLRKVVFWATLNWLFDAASLWMFLRAFGGIAPASTLLIVAFGLANVMAAIPILPGGLGVVEGTYIAVLVGFGMPTAGGRSCRRRLPVSAVPDADRARRDRLRVPARRSVEDRATRPAHPSARPRHGWRRPRASRGSTSRCASSGRAARIVDEEHPPPAMPRRGRSRSDTCPPHRRSRPPWTPPTPMSPSERARRDAVRRGGAGRRDRAM